MRVISNLLCRLVAALTNCFSDGAVRLHTAGTATLKDATSEAIRDWVTNVESTHYILVRRESRGGSCPVMSAPWSAALPAFSTQLGPFGPPFETLCRVRISVSGLQPRHSRTEILIGRAAGVRCGAAPVPDDGPRLPLLHRQGDAQAVHGEVERAPGHLHGAPLLLTPTNLVAAPLSPALVPVPAVLSSDRMFGSLRRAWVGGPTPWGSSTSSSTRTRCARLHGRDSANLSPSRASADSCSHRTRCPMPEPLLVICAVLRRCA